MMIRRRSSLAGWLGAALFVATGSACDVWAGGIAVLKSDELPSYNQALEGVQAALLQSAPIVEYVVPEQVADARRIGQTVRASRPNLVIAIGLRAAVAAKLEIPKIPTVFCLVLSPERYGLPASNMVGISMHPSVEYQLASVQSIAPHAKRIGLLHSHATEASFLAATVAPEIPLPVWS